MEKSISIIETSPSSPSKYFENGSVSYRRMPFLVAAGRELALAAERGVGRQTNAKSSVVLVKGDEIHQGMRHGGSSLASGEKEGSDRG